MADGPLGDGVRGAGAGLGLSLRFLFAGGNGFRLGTAICLVVSGAFTAGDTWRARRRAKERAAVEGP